MFELHETKAVRFSKIQTVRSLVMIIHEETNNNYYSYQHLVEFLLHDYFNFSIFLCDILVDRVRYFGQLGGVPIMYSETYQM